MRLRFFVCNIILFAILFVIIDFSFGKLMDSVFFSQHRKVTYVLEECNERVLIFGSSRAQHHYNTHLMTDSLGFSIYNAGVSGQNIFFHYALLKSVLNRQKPQLIILEVFDIDIYKTPSSWDRDKLSALYPYYNRDSVVQEIVNLKSPYEKYFMLSNLLRYNSLLPQTLILEFNNNGCEKAFENYGYMAIDSKKCVDTPLEDYDEHKYNGEIDSFKLKYISKFISLCKENDVSCVLVISPLYARTNNSVFIKETRKIADKQGIVLYDYSNYPDLMHPEYFKDINHLNDLGSSFFSNIILDIIRDYTYD